MLLCGGPSPARAQSSARVFWGKGRVEGSALDGTHQNALGKVLLQEGIDADDEHRTHHDGVFDGVGGRPHLHLGQHVVRQRALRKDDHLAQQHRDGELVRVADVDHGALAIVPVAHCVEQREGGDGGHGHGDHDVQEGLNLVAAVDAGGFLNGGGSCWKKFFMMIRLADEISTGIQMAQ